MTKVEFTLPDALAEAAAKAGLLAPEALERLLSAQLRTAAVDRLFEHMEKIQAITDPAPMTPEEVAIEIRAMRAERRRAKTA
jgi:hypothetical protein